MNLYRETDTISGIRKGRLRCLGHVTRVPEGRTVKRVFKNIPDGKCSVGKPKKRWLVDVYNDLKKMSVRDWRKIARGRYAWKCVLKGARPYKQWRRELRLSKWASGALAPRPVYFGRNHLRSRRLKSMKHIGIILFHLDRYYILFAISSVRLITCEINKIYKKYKDLLCVWAVGRGEGGQFSDLLQAQEALITALCSF